MSKQSRSPRIGLVLSGGGVRAMVFHIGLLQHLAERSLLESVERISSVSGGSLLVGLIFQANNMRWPTSDEFLSSVLPSLKKKICSSSLQAAAVRQLRKPANWRFLLSRANLLAMALQDEWEVTGKLRELPAHPEWSINGTTAETGKRFRFKPSSLGEYQIGYAAPGNFPLASALAVSAAFPGGFGPLTLKASHFTWMKRPAWNSPAGSETVVDSGYRNLHLYDGGVYDNLGLEPYFDSGRAVPKIDGLYILVSDAGAPLQTGFSYWAMNPWRLKRVADIMAEQSRSLRVRTFMNHLERNPNAGAYAHIVLPDMNGVDASDARHPARFPTTLRKLSVEEFERLADHGRCIANGLAWPDRTEAG